MDAKYGLARELHISKNFVEAEMLMRTVVESYEKSEGKDSVKTITATIFWS